MISQLAVPMLLYSVQAEYEGMLGALADIQSKGDSMLAGIRWQQDMLGRLEMNLETAERKMKETERKTEELELVKKELEKEVEELHGRKNKLMSKMEVEEQELER